MANFMTEIVKAIANKLLKPSDENKTNKNLSVEEGSIMDNPLVKLIAYNLEVFLNLLDTDPVIQAFLDKDMSFLIADNYLIAMVFVYFMRADLHECEYNAYNFFIALHLAHDMEEDEESLKDIMLEWAFGKKWRTIYPAITADRDNLLRQMEYRAVVHATSCHKLFAVHPHWAWQRSRSDALKREESNQTNTLTSLSSAARERCEEIYRIALTTSFQHLLQRTDDVYKAGNDLKTCPSDSEDEE